MVSSSTFDVCFMYDSVLGFYQGFEFNFVFGALAFSTVVLGLAFHASNYKPPVIKNNSYTPRTLRACCSQSKFRILKIRESSARALFLYNCTPNTLRARERRRRMHSRTPRIDSFTFWVILFCW